MFWESSFYELTIAVHGKFQTAVLENPTSGGLKTLRVIF